VSEVNDWNRKIIEEFRTNEGKVGGPFEGAPMILVHSKGRKSGKEYVNPLVYQDLGDGRIAVFGSRGGSPENPQWYYNILANPDLTVEVGTETFEVKAHEAVGDEREPIWEAQKKRMPGFAEYEAATKGVRDIPVIVLERRD
jgi:deazaflavin-dependent oxidoreductase (nitroreductase family)